MQAAVGGWPHPWPNVEELARVLPAHQWTLIGGLMTQLHAINRGIGVVRPTNDVDIVLHIETSRGVPAKTATALESIGYRLVSSVDPRNQAAHRFTRGTSHIDLLTSDPYEDAGTAVDQVKVQKRRAKQGDIVDVLVADHAAPSVEEKLRGKEMVKADGATQALHRLDPRGQPRPSRSSSRILATRLRELVHGEHTRSHAMPMSVRPSAHYDAVDRGVIGDKGEIASTSGIVCATPSTEGSVDRASELGGR